MEFQLSGESLVTLIHSRHTDTNCSTLHYNFFNVLDDNVLDDDVLQRTKRITIMTGHTTSQMPTIMSITIRP